MLPPKVSNGELFMCFFVANCLLVYVLRKNFESNCSCPAGHEAKSPASPNVAGSKLLDRVARTGPCALYSGGAKGRKSAAAQRKLQCFQVCVLRKSSLKTCLENHEASLEPKGHRSSTAAGPVKNNLPKEVKKKQSDGSKVNALLEECLF